jgi:hypothetical protein
MKCASLSLSFVSSFFVAVSKARAGCCATRAASRRLCCCASRLFGEDGIVNCGTARKALELVCQDCRRARGFKFSEAFCSKTRTDRKPNLRDGAHRAGLQKIAEKMFVFSAVF